MISHKYKCIFIHIPKTGGTSITKILDRSDPNAIHNANRGADHSTAQAIVKKFGQEIWNEYFTFAFTRNPFDRFISSYAYSMRMGKKQRWKKPRRQLRPYRNNFEQFVIKYASNKKNVFRLLHFKPQYKWINGQKLDFVGRFENLQDDFDFVCERLGISQTTLPILRKTEHKSYRELLKCPYARANVRQLYQKDLTKFSYKF